MGHKAQSCEHKLPNRSWHTQLRRLREHLPGPRLGDDYGRQVQHKPRGESRRVSEDILWRAHRRGGTDSRREDYSKGFGGKPDSRTRTRTDRCHLHVARQQGACRQVRAARCLPSPGRPAERNAANAPHRRQHALAQQSDRRGTCLEGAVHMQKGRKRQGRLFLTSIKGDTRHDVAGQKVK